MKSLLLLARLIPAVLAAPAVVNRAAAPTVIISAPQATIIGTTAESGKVESFSGVPFALPPVGQLRLKPPVALTAAQGTITATGTAKACPQMFFSVSASQFPTNVLGELIDTPLFQTVTDAGEDCLTINIRRPAGTTASSKLPVLFWIFGGGFELGSTSMYDGSSLVSDSITMGKPVIFVAVNYRVAGFGFLPGKEILADGSSNLGLLDQRLGLKWTADNIAAFGGDPDKVTIWGESAGAISVFDQMAMYDGDHTYKGKPLFRGGIMNSGSIVPADPVDCAKGQVVYDTVVSVGGCSNASDTLACLRGLDYETYLNAANSVPGLLSYSSIALSYVPRPDGTALTQSPDLLALAGKYAPVPFIIGDQEDEGTLFALFQTNISTTAQVIDYLKTYFFNEATTAQVTELVNSYPDNASDGSPFRTGALNEVYPQFKRLAAILGDATFTLSRRALLNVAKAVKPTVPTWSYLSSYDYGTAFLGTFHGSDLLQVFYGILPNYASASIHNYYFNFVYNLDPNNATGTTAASYPDWPKWSNGTNLMQFYAMSSNLLPDTFRNTSYQVLAKYTDSFRI